MLRLAACLVALSGCATVWGLEEEDIEPAACGPYVDETPLVFPAELPDAHNFNIAHSRAGVLFRGSVVSMASGTTQTIILNSTDGITWTQSPDPEEIMPDSLVGRLVGSGNDVFVTDLDKDDVSVFHFDHAWVPDSFPAFTMQGAEVGNAVRTVNLDGVEQFRRLSVTFLDDQGKRTLLMSQRSAPAEVWTLNPIRTASINTDPDLVDLGQAVMSGDMNTVVYAAKYRDDTSFGLFASALDVDDSFHKGIKIDGVSGSGSDADVLEPAITPDCKQIYYRRGDQTFTAHAP